MSKQYYKEWRKLNDADAASDDSSEGDMSVSGSEHDETVTESSQKSSSHGIGSQLSSEIDLAPRKGEKATVNKIEDFTDEIPDEEEKEEFENGSLMNTVPDATGLNF